MLLKQNFPGNKNRPGNEKRLKPTTPATYIEKIRTLKDREGGGRGTWNTAHCKLSQSALGNGCSKLARLLLTDFAGYRRNFCQAVNEHCFRSSGTIEEKSCHIGEGRGEEERGGEEGRRGRSGGRRRGREEGRRGRGGRRREGEGGEGGGGVRREREGGGGGGGGRGGRMRGGGGGGVRGGTPRPAAGGENFDHR